MLDHNDKGVPLFKYNRKHACEAQLGGFGRRIGVKAGSPVTVMLKSLSPRKFAIHVCFSP